MLHSRSASLSALRAPVPAAGHDVRERVAEQHDARLTVSFGGVEIYRPDLDAVGDLEIAHQLAQPMA